MPSLAFGGVPLLHPSLPYAPGSNASSFAVVVFSALPASPTPVIPLAMAGAAPAGDGDSLAPLTSDWSLLE